MIDDRLSIRRQLVFALFVIMSQMLLIAVTVAWLIHMVIIAMNGSVYFVERDPVVLWGEISATVIIILFATRVLVMQIQRLDETRASDDRVKGSLS